LVGASSLLLLGATMGRPPLWLVYTAAGLSAGLGGLETPTRSALIPNLVGRDPLSSAFTLHQIMWNTTMIIGPAIAGLIIARLGLVWAYAIDVGTYAATIVSVALMRPAPPNRDGPAPAAGIRALREGLRYLPASRAPDGVRG
jgi:MFS family permease